MSTLQVSEIFQTIQGESSRSGLPCVMVRLAGCNLRCAWCDTAYAQNADAGEELDLEAILEKVAGFQCPRVEVTGGEPLLQAAASELLRRLCEAGYETLLETNGTVDISGVDSRVKRVVDIKCPSSGHEEDTLWSNLKHLGHRDEVKFVIADRQDYEYARQAVEDHRLCQKCTVIFSPVWENLTASHLAEWILADSLDVRLGVQLHKLIWPNEGRG
jgi:7-carboxy-7-deazaguanine synthase